MGLQDPTQVMGIDRRPDELSSGPFYFHRSLRMRRQAGGRQDTKAAIQFMDDPDVEKRAWLLGDLHWLERAPRSTEIFPLERIKR